MLVNKVGIMVNPCRVCGFNLIKILVDAHDSCAPFPIVTSQREFSPIKYIYLIS